MVREISQQVWHPCRDAIISKRDTGGRSLGCLGTTTGYHLKSLRRCERIAKSTNHHTNSLGKCAEKFSQNEFFHTFSQDEGEVVVPFVPAIDGRRPRVFLRIFRRNPKRQRTAALQNADAIPLVLQFFHTSLRLAPWRARPTW